MSFKKISNLPSAEDIAERYPATPEHKIAERRTEVANVLEGKDKRLLVITGLCSAFPFDTVREYSDRLARLREEIGEQLCLVLRTYIQKPRTTVGWSGPLNQPNPLGKPNIKKGILQCRAMMCDVAKEHPLADEMLFTHNRDYFGSLLSYVALGARSAEDMEHRYIASGVDMPVGVKNPTSGDIGVGINGVEAVQASHDFAHHGEHVHSSGNPHAHLILRGGKESSNYGPRSIAIANKGLLERGVQNPAIIVDASHDNSRNGTGKDPLLQEHVLRDVLLGKTTEREEYQFVRGFMIESNIKGGSQKIRRGMDPSVSITDPCLSWEDTERILRSIADQLCSDKLALKNTEATVENSRSKKIEPNSTPYVEYPWSGYELGVPHDR